MHKTLNLTPLTTRIHKWDDEIEEYYFSVVDVVGSLVEVKIQIIIGKY